ncbi:hypothetical protein [Pedobacter suwonensis]|uniref:hypothetical protein n=1 Tax=Pedobacter suwonensis TaxID=332999 RepID=UPI0011A289D7|nr:hypothetical protein [Pedobacter suwonensis]
MKQTFLRCLIGLTTASSLLFNSCSKPELAYEKNNKENFANPKKVMGLPSPNLAFDQLSAFPFGPTETVPAPWAGGTGRSFPVQYLDDYRGSDGWELYYNTFTTARKANDPFFIIYNRYRGLMRLYYYMVPKSGASTDVVTFQLDLRGTTNTSSILNFEQGELVNFDQLNTISTKVQNEKIVQSGTWYAEEFELAYDPNLLNTSYVANQLRWSMYSTSISQITLDGTQKGSIDGTIQTPNPTGSSLFGSLLKGAISVGVGQLGILATGSKALGNFFSKKLGPLKLEDVKNGVQEAAKGESKSGGKSIFNAVLSAIKGGSNDPGFSEQKINLKLNTQISLNGSITQSPEGMFNPVVFISNTQGLENIAPDYIPNYPASLGVFNISNTPTVKIYKVIPPVEEPSDVPSNLNTYIYSYELDQASFNILFNPAVINGNANGATIQNLKKEVVLLSPTGSRQPAEVVGNKEYLDESTTAYTDFSYISFVTSLKTFEAPANLYVRISFDVVPNNSSIARTTIIKTFLAKSVKQY